MFEAVPALRMFISYRKGPCYVWRRIGSASPAPPPPPPPPPPPRDGDGDSSSSDGSTNSGETGTAPAQGQGQGQGQDSQSDSAPPRPLLLVKRTWLSIPLSEDTFRAVDPDHPIDLFVTNVPHGPPLAAPRIINIYNAPIVPPASRSAKTFQEL